ncbi:MAG: type II toxin-antitoxin system VapC family toxin [Acidobacteria bacterium]|nr:type II toxin-antitoxin system VapC family toxin [Acidobacteriota bacterium]
MILLDTNVLAELCRQRPDPAVEHWAGSALSPFGLSVVTVEEIQFGLAWKPNARIESLIDRFLAERCEIFPVTMPVARRAGTLRGQFRRTGRTRTQADMLIAATAQVHQLPVATRNVRDFEGCGLALLNPFESMT